MPPNAFDQASRFAAKLDPHTFFAWATGLLGDRLGFGGWLDTRSVPFPGATDHTGDTVARVTNPTVAEAPWAVAVEFQIEPDPLMFGRLMIYLGYLWQSLKPDEERGSRFNVAAVVLNLTGTGNATREMRWPDAGFVTQLGVVERNLARENADDLLAGIEGGQWSRGVLPWLPLMTGGNDPGIIDRWKAIAEAEPDFRMKANYAGLALTFASAAGRESIWEKSLEGWNVRESTVVNKWKAAQAAVMLIAVLEAKFGQIPAEVETKLRETLDLGKLQTWVTEAAKIATLAEFRAAAGL